MSTSSVRTVSAPANANEASEDPQGGGEARKFVEISVIVPVTDRPEPLEEIYREYAPVLEAMNTPFEFIFVAEPWTRELMDDFRNAYAAEDPIRLLEVGQAMGESALLKLAAAESRGDILLTLPAYHRVQAEALPRLIARVRGGADLAVARRWPRTDSWFNRLQNRIFHGLLHVLSRGEIRDSACGVRAMRREVMEQVPLYGDLSRFLPVLGLQEGYRVEEIDAPQHPRDRETRVYRPGIYLRRMIDLFGLYFLIRFTYKPLRFFGLVGSTLSVVGAAILFALGAQWFSGISLADRPMLLLGLLLVTLGVQALALGLIGEIIVHLNVPDRQRYRTLESHGLE